MAAIDFATAATSPQSNFAVKSWASPEEMKKLSSGDVLHDVILGEGVSVSRAPSPEWRYQRNANALIVAGSGQGKTRSVIIPNLLNHDEVNYIITDTKKELKRATAEGFAEDGYCVQVLDTIDLEKSCAFNPFAYIEEESDIPSFAKLLFDTVSPNRYAGTSNNEDFWNATAELLLEALIGICYALEETDGKFSKGWKGGREPRYLNMDHLLRLLDLIDVAPDGVQNPASSPLDLLVSQLAAGVIEHSPLDGDGSIRFSPKPYCLGVEQYRSYSIAAEKTMRSIVITLQATLYRFKTEAVKRVFSHDELGLDDIDQGKRVLYLIMSDNDATNDFIGRMVLKLLLNRALRKADSRPDGKLERPVMFVLDEFANLGCLPDFQRCISIARSRRMSFLVCIQSVGQLRYVYGADRAQIIMDNCDSLAFLGSGSTYESAEYFSKLCGESVLGTNRAGIEGTVVEQRGIVMTPSDISQLSRENCIVKVSGLRPFLTKKYDVLKHPNAKRFLTLGE